MHMPGFTAEASLHRATHYQIGSILAELQQSGEVLVYPALKFQCGALGCCFEFTPGSMFCCYKDGICDYFYPA
jgi:hypothetical protein